jgi:hypothetical protein
MAAATQLDILHHLRKTLSHLKCFLRTEDPNNLVVNVAENLGVFGDVETALFYEDFILAHFPDNTLLHTMVEEIRRSTLALVWLLVTIHHPSMADRGNPFTKSVFKSNGTTANSQIQRFLQDKLDLIFLSLLFKDSINSRENDRKSPPDQQVSQIVRFVFGHRQEEFQRLSEGINKALAEEETSGVVNWGTAYLLNNFQRFSKLVGSVNGLLNLADFLLFHNNDCARIWTDSTFLKGFLWRAYFYFLDLQAQLKQLVDSGQVAEGTDFETVLQLIDSMGASHRCIIQFVNNFFEGLETIGIFEAAPNDKFNRSKIKVLEKTAQALVPLFDQLLKKHQTEQTLKSLVGVHVKYIVRNTPKMRQFLAFAREVVPLIYNEAPAMDRTLKYWKPKIAATKDKKQALDKKVSVIATNELDELSQPLPKTKVQESQSQGLLDVLVKKAQGKSKPSFKVKEDLFEGIYDDEYDDTFDTPLYGLRETNKDSDNEEGLPDAEDDGDGSSKPQHHRFSQPKDPQTRPPPNNDYSRRDRVKKNKRDYNNKQRGTKGGSGSQGSQYVEKSGQPKDK